MLHKCTAPRLLLTFVEDEGWHRAAARYSEFLRRHEGQNILFWEIGVGYNTPVIIKYPFWRMTAKNPNTFYACINQNQAVCPPEVQRQSVCIHADIGAVTRRRRTDHFYDRSTGTVEECRPRSKGAAPFGSADLMQKFTTHFKAIPAYAEDSYEKADRAKIVH